MRTATSADDDFLFALFASTRSDELAALANNPAHALAFIKMQFTAQSQSYKAAYPSAENNIIMLGEEPIGRMLVARGAREFELIDIALLPDYRNSGIGGALLQGLLDDAAAKAKPIRLQVFNSNPARRLYERLGFCPVSTDGVYLEMKWPGELQQKTEQ